MFSGFNLLYDAYDETFYKKGLIIYSEFQTGAKKALDQYIGVNGTIDGSAIQSDWFPQLKADIFLSHSHGDEAVAITLAGMLSTMGISVFIDSCIWGYAPQLLKEIDNKFCMNDSRTNYIYEERNKSTSHVYMMLSTALNMMIDKTESIFFLNTPKSINPSHITDETASPWIYAEIAMTKLIRKKEINEYRPNLTKGLTESIRSFSKSLEVRYKLDSGHLTPLSMRDLINWVNQYNRNSLHTRFALDVLYEICDVQQ